MKWIPINNSVQLEEIKKISEQQPILIFKHSIRCSISAMVLSRLERTWKEEEMTALKPYFLDLINYRSVSNAVADFFDVQHESPQILLIYKGACVYDTSHMDISYPALKTQLEILKVAA